MADRGSVGSFTLSAQFLPSNDACLGATPLTLPANVVDSTSGATLDVGLPACVGPLGDQDFSVVAPGVWFSIALPTSSSAGALALSLDTLGSSFDTRLSVFQGDCGTLVPVTANDDIDASGASRVVFAASEGLTYSVLVHGAAGATGSFVLNAEVLDSPGNDDCGDAVQLSGDSGDVQGTLEGASGSAASYGSLALAPCGGPWGPFDVWYRFDATCTTELKLSTCGNFDTVLSVHTGCPGAFDAFALVGACNDDGDSSCAPGSSLTVQVNAGTAYFVRVAQRDGALPGDDFELEWETLDSDGDGIDSDGDGTADCNDLCPNDPLKIAPGTCGCGVSDDDSDGDGTADCNDLCPNDPLKIAPGTCGCGIVDEDLDADGVVDCLDNCPTVANPSQGDCDLDGVGDACEIAAGALDTDLDGVPDACELGQVHTYCTAGTSTNGCVPTLSLSGPPSLSGAPFLVQASDLEGLKSSLLFYSLTGPRVQPWAPSSTSFLCINGPTQRTSARSTGGSAGLCDGSFALDLLLWGAANPSSLGVPFAPGDVFAAQVWYRDPPAPRGTNLSAAIQITFAP
ncbi:MAG: thrombospondin type 3 repeat-containing protein [Planctomycetaceae bacterium]|nr:thrombospondin type 3 repeat-containing protein [Planctomycetaceae bacterium]